MASPNLPPSHTSQGHGSDGARFRTSEIADHAERPPAGGVRPLGSAPLDWRATSRPGGDTARAIASRIVALLRKHTGRGPTKAKAIISPDLVVITLADCLTTAERHVAAAGHGELIAHTRKTLHQGMEAEATAIVEELTHSSVIAHLTAQHHDPDLAILVFYLAT